jgi:hypothetical protein
VLAFLDTEFTDLVVWPRLLSVGLVAEGGKSKFYAEVTDPDRIRATGPFGKGAVLSQFGKIAGAACSYADLGGRLSTFLQGLVAEQQSGEFIDLAFGYDLDWTLVDLAIQDSGALGWDSLRCRIRPVNVYELTGFDAGKMAADAYFKTQALAPFSRHHALCDARALRVAYEAGQRAAAKPAQPLVLLDGRTLRTLTA